MVNCLTRLLNNRAGAILLVCYTAAFTALSKTKLFSTVIA